MRWTDCFPELTSLRNVKVLTLPHMEFQFCNVYRGTCGKTLPLMLLPCCGTQMTMSMCSLALSQLLPCLKDINTDHWSMIVFGMRVHQRRSLPNQMLASISRMSRLHVLNRTCQAPPIDPDLEPANEPGSFLLSLPPFRVFQQLRANFQ